MLVAHVALYHRTMRWVIAALLVTACGRLHFDPFGAAGDGSTPNSEGAAPGGDGGPSDASGIDGPPAACKDAIPVTVNVPISKNTCDTGLDRIDGCAGAALAEL